MGYPVGGESISITVGVVSRIEVRAPAVRRARACTRGRGLGGTRAPRAPAAASRQLRGGPWALCQALNGRRRIKRRRSRSTLTAATICLGCRSTPRWVPFGGGVGRPEGPSADTSRDSAQRPAPGAHKGACAGAFCSGAPCSKPASRIPMQINGGNSGGPVFNGRGQCVGIAFQALSGSDVENVSRAAFGRCRGAARPPRSPLGRVPYLRGAPLCGARTHLPPASQAHPPTHPPHAPTHPPTLRTHPPAFTGGLRDPDDGGLPFHDRLREAREVHRLPRTWGGLAAHGERDPPAGLRDGAKAEG